MNARKRLLCIRRDDETNFECRLQKKSGEKFYYYATLYYYIQIFGDNTGDVEILSKIKSFNILCMFQVIWQRIRIT